MKIGFLIYNLQGGGAERVVSNLANQFVNVGYETFIFLFAKEDIKYKLDSRVKIIACDIKKTGNRYYRTLRRIRLIRHQLLKVKPDILFAFTVSMVPYALISTIGMQCKVIGTERANPKTHTKGYQLVIKYLSELCDGYIFQTKGALNYYPKKTGSKAVVIGNPLSGRLCEWKKIPGMRICTVGRLHDDKDFFTLIYAFKEFHKFYPQSSLTIFGEGPLKEHLVNHVEKLKLKNAVCFKGFVEDLSSQIAEYSVFAFSSKSEGMPNALMEALAAGMPCISTDCEFGPGELIEQGRNGILVKTGNAEELKEALIWMAEHEDERISMGAEAKKILETYSVDKITEQYRRYAELIS